MILSFKVIHLTCVLSLPDKSGHRLPSQSGTGHPPGTNQMERPLPASRVDRHQDNFSIRIAEGDTRTCGSRAPTSPSTSKPCPTWGPASSICAKLGRLPLPDQPVRPDPGPPGCSWSRFCSSSATRSNTVVAQWLHASRTTFQSCHLGARFLYSVKRVCSKS